MHPRLLRPRRARLRLQREREERQGLAQRGARPQLAALCPAPARCERPGKGGKASGKRGKRGWGRGGKLSARETAAFWRETAALRREMQPAARAASGMLPGATERAQAAGVSRTPAMLFQDFVLGRSKGLSQEGQRHGAGAAVGAELGARRALPAALPPQQLANGFYSAPFVPEQMTLCSCPGTPLELRAPAAACAGVIQQ